jgi:hypothetical protein
MVETAVMAVEEVGVMVAGLIISTEVLQLQSQSR